MKKILILICFIFSNFLYAKDVEVTFHFDIPYGVMSYSNTDTYTIGKIHSLNFHKNSVKLKLKNGKYLFAFHDKKDKYLIKKFFFNYSRDYNIYFIPKEKSKISGNIFLKNKKLENTQIAFTDKQGRIFYTTSNENGKYQIDLPNGDYFVSSAQFGYKIAYKKNINLKNKTNKRLPIFLKHSKGEIKGKILDENLKPIPKAKILIFNNQKEKIILSDNNGNFVSTITPGINTIDISKKGYLKKSFIKNFNHKTNIKNYRVVLKPKIFTISGTLKNKNLPIVNKEIFLYSKDNKLLETIKSDKNGNFSFVNVKENGYYIHIDEDAYYKSYNSKNLYPDKNIKNLIITLKIK